MHVYTYNSIIHFGLFRKLELVLEFDELLYQFPSVLAHRLYRPGVNDSIWGQGGGKLDFGGRLGFRLDPFPRV